MSAVTFIHLCLFIYDTDHILIEDITYFKTISPDTLQYAAFWFQHIYLSSTQASI
jgi:hypothetical protein